jgi:hypothetical protein
MRPAAHLADQALLLHLAAELAQRLLELLRILDDYLQVSITPFLLSVRLPGDAEGRVGTVGLGNHSRV